jgi:hypothetical protein
MDVVLNPQAAEMRAKVNTITPIRAQSRSPITTTVLVPMHNPALSVKAPRQKLGKGKTPVLTADEAGELPRSWQPRPMRSPLG